MLAEKLRLENLSAHNRQSLISVRQAQGFDVAMAVCFMVAAPKRLL
jgi:hypothetical protein